MPSEGATRHVRLGEALREVEDLLDAWRRSARHEHERDLVAAKHCLDPRGQLLKAAEQVVQLADELRHRLEEGAARDPPDRAQDRGRALRDEVQRELPAGPERLHEPLHGRRIERLHEALRRVQEVERVRGRGGKNDDFVARVALDRDALLHAMYSCVPASDVDTYW